MSYDMQAWQHQAELEQQELLSADSYGGWLNEHNNISSADMFVYFAENQSLQMAYLKEFGLPLNSTIQGV